MIYTSRRLQNTKHYKNYSKHINMCYKNSLEKEHKQQNYLSHMRIANANTGEVIKMNYSFENYYKKYTKSIEQKVYAIEKIAHDRDLEPIFITLTLPTEYHPFKSIDYKDKRLYTSLNKSFNFKSIDEAITSGYKLLNHIYRTFYKRVKNNVDDLLYVKVVEAHKTLIPHFHILFYVKKEKKEIIRKIFSNIKNRFGLNQTDIEFMNNELGEKQDNSSVKTGVNRASKYLMKYVIKNLKSNEDFYYARILDGWKRNHKIRMITTSNLPLSLAEYRELYHNIDKEYKDALLKEAKSENVNIFYYVLKNLSKIIVTKKFDKSEIKKYKDMLDKRFTLIKRVIREKLIDGTYRYKLDKFTFFDRFKLTYEKQKYLRL